jgi:group I intron endonuclease
MLIYKATNIINGKIYIGKTVKALKSRIAEHKADINRGQIFHFHRALIKYGFDNFKWEILEKANDLDELNRLECYYIELFNSRDRLLGYNIAYGGCGGGNRIGVILSDETKKKISTAKTGISWGNHTEESKRQISSKRKGIKFSDTHRSNLCKARSKRTTTEATRHKMSISSKGKINIKQYKLIDPLGVEYKTTAGLSAFCEEHRLTPSALHKVLKGTRSHHRGWVISKI